MFVPFSFFPNFSSKISPQPFKDRNFIFGKQVHNDKLYRGIANEPSPICSSFCLFLFLSFQIFRQRYLHNRLKIETSYLVYRSTTTSCIVGLQMSLLLFVLPFVCSFFFLSRFFVKDISTTVYDRNFKFGIQVHNNKLYTGIENGPSPICSSLCLFFFLSLQIFRQRYLHNRLR